MMMNFPRIDDVEKRRREGNIRALSITRDLVDFTSSDYLGLARSEQLFERVIQEYHSHKQDLAVFGTKGSRLLSGNSNYAENLEREIGEYHGFESATLFNSGYMANIGLLQAIGGKDATIFYDSMIHASSIDGMRLSPSIVKPFRHNDLKYLEKQLQRFSGGRCYVLVESIYSMDGSIAPLKELARLTEGYNVHLIVDEAHSVGIYGSKGRGVVHELSLQDKVFAVVFSYGKAFAVGGGAVLSSHHVRELLLNFAKTLIYTSALTGFALASIRAAYLFMPQLDNEIKKLKLLIRGAKSHIQSIPVNGNEAAKALSKRVEVHGFELKAILSPTVRRGQEMLRLCLHSFNTQEEIAELFKLIEGTL